MNVQTLRRIDRLIGAPLCALLTVVRRLEDLLQRRPQPDAPRRIAVIKLAEQGATVVAYPALLRAREMVGAENLFFVVFAENRFILDLLEVVPRENVIAIRTEGLLRVTLDTLAAIRRLRREKVDASVDFEFFARSSAILCYLSGARSRVGLHAWAGEASYRGDLMTHRLSMNPFLHAGQMFQLLVQALTLPANGLPGCDLKPARPGTLPRLRPGGPELEEVRDLVRRALGVRDLPALVLLNANCSDLVPLRRWSPRRYRELAERLLERYPEMAVVLTGAPAETRDAEALAAEIGSPRCVSLAGRTTLRQLVTLYDLAEVMVTNDSGPAHYAMLTGLDVVTLFGPENPAVFGAQSPQSHILWAGLACSPCVNAFNDRQSSCPFAACMERITVDEVFVTVCRVYEDRRSRIRSSSAEVERSGSRGTSSTRPPDPSTNSRPTTSSSR